MQAITDQLNNLGKLYQEINNFLSSMYMENENLNFKPIVIGNQETMRVTRACKVFSKTNLKYFSHDYGRNTY